MYDLTDFNPRSHEGSDSCSPLITSSKFNNFNPRSHEGSDMLGFKIYRTHTISIHAPTRGATNPDHSHQRREVISIHAPTRGATNASPFFLSPTLQFQSTLPRGERHDLQEGVCLFFSDFNPRSHEGSDWQPPVHRSG